MNFSSGWRLGTHNTDYAEFRHVSARDHISDIVMKDRGKSILDFGGELKALTVLEKTNRCHSFCLARIQKFLVCKAFIAKLCYRQSQRVKPDNRMAPGSRPQWQ